MIYKFEIYHIKFCEKARSELCRTVASLWDINCWKKVGACYWMSSQKVVEDLCGTALASLPEDHDGDPQTEVISSAHYLNDWMEDVRWHSRIVKENGRVK